VGEVICDEPSLRAPGEAALEADIRERIRSGVYSFIGNARTAMHELHRANELAALQSEWLARYMDRPEELGRVGARFLDDAIFIANKAIDLLRRARADQDALSTEADRLAALLQEGRKDCASPVKRGNWLIYPTDPLPPIPSWRDHAWTYAHKDYDGPEDGRCGTAPSVDACKEAIDEWEIDHCRCSAPHHDDCMALVCPHRDAIRAAHPQGTDDGAARAGTRVAAGQLRERLND
jgi:hypothetical protein